MKKIHFFPCSCSASDQHRAGAATRVQAWWRGTNLRKRLQIAMEYAQVDDDDDDLSFGEVDLDAFNFNEV